MSTAAAVPPAPTGAPRPTPPRPIQFAVLLMVIVSGLLLTDAVVSVGWWGAPIRPDDLADDQWNYLVDAAHSDAAWAAAGNLIAAVAAGSSAVWLLRGHRWGRPAALTTITGFGIYRLTVMVNEISQLAADGPRPEWTPTARLIIAAAVLPCLVVAGRFILHRTVTRPERHRALIGADDGPEPVLGRIATGLLLLSGCVWFAVVLLGFVAIGLWIDQGGSGLDGHDARLDFGLTMIAGALGVVGAAAVTGTGLVLWFRRPRALFWRAAMWAASLQLGGTVAAFLWETRSGPAELVAPPAGAVHALAQVLDWMTATHILVLAAALVLLWHPKVSGFFRSRR